MRFLCLHGAGTSAEIFEIQSGGLVQDLELQGHEFVYVNGRMKSASDTEFEGVFDGPFFVHCPRDVDPEGYLALAFEHTLNIIKNQGPFDGVMGFSQGAALAGSLLAHHAKTNPAPLFKVAIFICGAAPYESSGVKELTPAEGEGESKYPITIPTTHIVGSQDPYYEGSMKLHAVCEPAKAVLYDHGSRHHIPFDMQRTSEMVAAIVKSIERAAKGE